MPESLTKRLSTIERIPTNVLLLVLFTILIIFVGALTSILLFTYTATIHVSQDNQRNILLNKELNNIIINNTREVPLQNQVMLRDIQAALNQSAVNTEGINNTLNAIVMLNNNLVNLYYQFEDLVNRINNNTGSNVNMTIQNREMIGFLRDHFDEQFLTELKQDQIMKQHSLDTIIKLMTNSTGPNPTFSLK